MLVLVPYFSFSMAHMSVFPGNCEIVEIEEELNSGENYKGKNYTKLESKREEKGRRSFSSHTGHINSLEDDLNQLFEMFNRRASSHEYSRRSQGSTSKKNASKSPSKQAGTIHLDTEFQNVLILSRHLGGYAFLRHQRWPR